jgi:hypothetical protein
MKYLTTFAIALFILFSQAPVAVLAVEDNDSNDNSYEQFEVTSYSESDEMDESDDDYDDDDSDDGKDDESDDDYDDDKKFRVRAREVRSWDDGEKVEFMSQIKSHAQIQSGQELSNFAKGILLSDNEIEDISFDDEEKEVELDYKAKGNLFGFIPVKYNQKISVSPNAELEEEVEVKNPWYSFFVSQEKKSEEIKKEVEQSLKESAVEVSQGFAYYADLLERISASLRGLSAGEEN